MDWSLRHFVGVLLLARLALSQTYTSSGDSGEACGPEGRKCVEGKASCIGDECVCHEGFGDGYINCYKDNSVRTEIFNDPTVLTYNDNKIGLPIPCRYMWTHTKTHLKDKNGFRHGFCEFQAYAFHEKDKGKFFVRGFDVAISLTYHNGSTKFVSLRKHGKALDGDYSIYVDATDDAFLPDGLWGADEIKYNDPNTKLRLQCDHDDVNNLAILDVRRCGLNIQFRPYDCVLRRNQTQIPHLSYGVRCSFHPEFLSKDEVVAIPPARANDWKTIDDMLLPGMNREETLTYKALMSNAAQNPPFATDQCQQSRSFLEHCDDAERAAAFNNCLMFLKKPRFIACYDDTRSGALIMELFNRCIEVYCNGGSCAGLISTITNSGCDQIHDPYPEIAAFVNGTHCPP